MLINLVMGNLPQCICISTTVYMYSQSLTCIIQMYYNFICPLYLNKAEKNNNNGEIISWSIGTTHCIDLVSDHIGKQHKHTQTEKVLKSYLGSF